ncbi:hypothetical protein [Paludibacterium purpuratum]|uniref:Uncharacterized protein n=1 Tax=Paludibacterium purpuratum TaxID=1144873 RepID=A0A4R7BBA9_9NEIS|nr:hypothetical protein [Paludibacterium purpuratum]TDR82161.1 hypothetical protein DFP86_102275 [Paludibacterium purpuratum]
MKIVSNRPHCDVHGLFQRGRQTGMCQYIITGMVECGLDGECQHQFIPALVRAPADEQQHPLTPEEAEKILIEMWGDLLPSDQRLSVQADESEQGESGHEHGT